MFLYDKNIDPKKVNPYLQSPKNYEEAKKNIKPVIFHPVDVREFLNKHKGSNYEHIYLSNVIAYLSRENKFELILTTQRATNALIPGGETSIYSHFFLKNTKEYKESEDTFTRDLNDHGINGNTKIIHGEDPFPYSVLVFTKLLDS